MSATEMVRLADWLKRKAEFSPGRIQLDENEARLCEQALRALAASTPQPAAGALRVTFNLNEYIYVRLTQKALDYLRAKHERWATEHGLSVEYVPPKPDENGYSGFQAWAFIEDFGPLFPGYGHVRRWEDWFEDDLNVQFDPRSFQESAAEAQP